MHVSHFLLTVIQNLKNICQMNESINLNLSECWDHFSAQTSLGSQLKDGDMEILSSYRQMYAQIHTVHTSKYTVNRYKKAYTKCNNRIGYCLSECWDHSSAQTGLGSQLKDGDKEVSSSFRTVHIYTTYIHLGNQFMKLLSECWDHSSAQTGLGSQLKDGDMEQFSSHRKDTTI